MTLKKIVTLDALLSQAAKLRGRKFSPGFDKMTANAVITWLNINGKRLCEDLLKGRYQPMPALGFRRAKQSGYRKLSKLTAIDTVIEMLLLEVLTPLCEEAFSDSSYGYRPGKGVTAALQQYCVVGAKYNYVAKIDIRECFDHVNHNILDAALSTFISDDSLRTLVMQMVRMPLMLDGEVMHRDAGLLQGAPLSPLLLNIYLHSLDKTLEAANTCFIRYADDLVMFASNETELQQFTALARKHMTEQLGLDINDKKCRTCSPTSLHYLGCTFERDRYGLLVAVSEDAPQSAYHAWRSVVPKNPKHGVDILSDGILCQRDFSLAFENENGVYDIPVSVTDTINIYSDVIFDSGFLEKALKRGICIHLYNRQDRFLGRFTPEQPLHSPKVTFEQLQAYYDPTHRLELARQFVLASLHHQKLNVRYYHKQYPADLLAASLRKIMALEREIKQCETYDDLLLMEARGREIYYGCFELFLRRDEFVFEKRSRKPPHNEINALLSFGNMVLYGQLAHRINRSPLDVRVGFLHATNKRRESLNLDMADVYKPLLVDRTALALLNRRALQKHHFEHSESGGVYLTQEGRRIFLSALYDKQAETLRIAERLMSYDSIMTADVQALTRHFRTGERYIPYRQVK